MKRLVAKETKDKEEQIVEDYGITMSQFYDWVDRFQDE